MMSRQIMDLVMLQLSTCKFYFYLLFKLNILNRSYWFDRASFSCGALGSLISSHM